MGLWVSQLIASGLRVSSHLTEGTELHLPTWDTPHHSFSHHKWVFKTRSITRHGIQPLDLVIFREMTITGNYPSFLTLTINLPTVKWKRMVRRLLRLQEIFPSPRSCSLLQTSLVSQTSHAFAFMSTTAVPVRSSLTEAQRVCDKCGTNSCRYCRDVLTHTRDCEFSIMARSALKQKSASHPLTFEEMSQYIPAKIRCFLGCSLKPHQSI